MNTVMLMESGSRSTRNRLFLQQIFDRYEIVPSLTEKQRRHVRELRAVAMSRIWPLTRLQCRVPHRMQSYRVGGESKQRSASWYGGLCHVLRSNKRVNDYSHGGSINQIVVSCIENEMTIFSDKRCRPDDSESVPMRLPSKNVAGAYRNTHRWV